MTAIAGRFVSIEAVYVGAIAQLVERVVRNDEVGGSNPPGSTLRLRLRVAQPRKDEVEACPAKPAGRRRTDVTTTDHLFFARLGRGAATQRRSRTCPAKPAGRRRTERLQKQSLPRKPRRPLLHKTCHAFAEIAAAQRDDHLAVGVDGGFGKRL